MAAPELKGDELVAFRESLLGWFAEHGREFPWRMRRDAYAIMVSEKLLQQTAAKEVVVRAYDALLAAYPALVDLSQAAVDDLEVLLRPLGLTYRSRELVQLAQHLVKQCSGQIPESLSGLMQLPGIGEYSARAILSFAYGADLAVVDTNVARFLHRLYGIEGKLPANPARKRPLVELADGLVPAGRSRPYNLAVLDLCALVCSPRKPQCGACPVRIHCSFGNKGDL